MPSRKAKSRHTDGPSYPPCGRRRTFTQRQACSRMLHDFRQTWKSGSVFGGIKRASAILVQVYSCTLRIKT
eukprot:6803142-Pyramimonas_sp.AAC.1